MAGLNELSHARSTLIMNGERIQALSDVQPPIKFDPHVIGEGMTGQDGASYFFSKPVFASMVTVSLLPTSESGLRWQREYGRIQQMGEKIDYMGTYGIRPWEIQLHSMGENYKPLSRHLFQEKTTSIYFSLVWLLQTLKQLIYFPVWQLYLETNYKIRKYG